MKPKGLITKLLVINILLLFFIGLEGFIFNRVILPRRLAEVYLAGGAQATLELTKNVSVRNGGTTKIKVGLITPDTKVIAVDVVIDYDPAYLKVLNITPKVSSFFKTFAPVDANGNLDTNKAIKANKIKFGALAYDYASGDVLEGYQGNFIELAVIKVRGLQLGSTKMKFTFQAGKTRDSNVVAQGTTTDILASVQNSQIAIIEPSPSPEVSPSPSASPEISPSPSVSPSPSPEVSPSPSPGVSPSPSAQPSAIPCNNSDLNDDNFINSLDLFMLLEDWQNISNSINILLYILSNWSLSCI